MTETEEKKKEIEKQKEREEKYLAKLQKHEDILRSNTTYSIQRIDLLIISVSSAGIYVSLEIMKYITESKLLTLIQIKDFNFGFKITGALFLLSIIINFISQWSAYRANFYSLDSTKKKIEAKEYKVDNNEKTKELDALANTYNRTTAWTNQLSTILMIIGLALLMVFTWNLF
jgi:hypothetical protein